MHLGLAIQNCVLHRNAGVGAVKLKKTCYFIQDYIRHSQMKEIRLTRMEVVGLPHSYQYYNVFV